MTASNDGTAIRENLSPRLGEAKGHEAGQTPPTRRPIVLTPTEAARLVRSGDTILINGSGGGVGIEV